MADHERPRLEIRGAGFALLDDRLSLGVRGAAPDEALHWRARLRDDDGRVWRASADSAEELPGRWVPAKPGTGSVAALGSLRPVDLDVRVEAPDGRAASRTLTRRLVDEGVRLRRWRDGLAATLHLPADADGPRATVVLDATAGPDDAAVGVLAAALLASRGALVLAMPPQPARRSGTGGGDALAPARERLAAVPSAGGDVTVLSLPGDVPVPPGVPVRDGGRGGAAARAEAWDALLAGLGLRGRGRD